MISGTKEKGLPPMRKWILVLGVACLALLLTNSLLIAGNTGKIIGKVIDENKQALPGVTIIVVGASRGAATDPDGNYQIIGVPIGTYTVQARSVGYQPKDFTGVKVGADETTKLNIDMSTSAVELG